MPKVIKIIPLDIKK